MPSHAAHTPPPRPFLSKVRHDATDHHSDDGFSGKLVQVELDTLQFRTVHLHDVITDFAEYPRFSDTYVGVVPEPENNDLQQWGECGPAAEGDISLFPRRPRALRAPWCWLRRAGRSPRPPPAPPSPPS